MYSVTTTHFSVHHSSLFSSRFRRWKLRWKLLPNRRWYLSRKYVHSSLNKKKPVYLPSKTKCHNQYVNTLFAVIHPFVRVMYKSWDLPPYCAPTDVYEMWLSYNMRTQNFWSFGFYRTRILLYMWPQVSPFDANSQCLNDRNN